MRNLPDNVNENDSRAPWNWNQPEPLSTGSHCCGDIVMNGHCSDCHKPCVEEFESDDEMKRRMHIEREEYEEGMAEAMMG